MNLFNSIKNQLPILNVVNEYTTLKSTGVYWKGHCPFHNERTGSFTVSPHKDIFYCFGCHANGDVIAFIAKIENCSQIEAAKFLIERYNLKISDEFHKQINNESNSIIDKKKYYSVCKAFSKWCCLNFLDSTDAKKYLLNRGFYKEIIDLFEIGFFPEGQNSINALLKFMNKQNFLVSDLIQANIIFESKSILYSPFENRIIFPIKDSMGRFCGFGGRIFKNNDERVKYYNSHENIYFNKGSLLFGFDLAKKDIQKTGCAFLVEGYTDCLAMFQNGYTNTIATLGTACSVEQLKILSRFIKKLYVLYDGDNAGQKAVLRLTELCWDVNLELKVISLNENEDPASFLNKKGNLQQFVNKAKDIYSYFIETSCKKFSSKSLNEKINISRKLIDIIKNINDSLKRDILLQEMSTKLNIPFDSLKQELKGNLLKKQIQNEISSSNDNDSDIDITNLEKKIFTAIINNFNLLTEEQYFLVDFFKSPIKEILYILIEFKKDNEFFNFDNFIERLNDVQRQFINKILLEHEDDLSKDFKQMIMQFQKKNWREISIEVKKQLSFAEKNNDKIMMNKIISNYQMIKKKILVEEK